MNMRNVLGEYLRDLREAENVTQAEVAEALEVSQALVSRWESGKSFPTDHLTGLAEFYGVDLVRLIERQFEICNPTERAILDDAGLSRRDQDTMLAAYGVLTNRDSLGKAAAYRMRISMA